MTPGEFEASRMLVNGHLELISLFEQVSAKFLDVLQQVRNGAPADEIMADRIALDVTIELRRTAMLRRRAATLATDLGVGPTSSEVQ